MTGDGGEDGLSNAAAAADNVGGDRLMETDWRLTELTEVMEATGVSEVTAAERRSVHCCCCC